LGLKLGGLGFGFPSSMTDQHTSIMRTMAKPKSVASFRIGQCVSQLCATLTHELISNVDQNYLSDARLMRCDGVRQAQEG